ncbi:MAG: response regulator [Candidatus Bathyarchaeia archaeon]
MDKNRKNVLLIEDNPADARLVQEMFADAGATPQFELKHASQLSTGLDFLGKGGIDVILLDLLLPDSHGLDTFTKTQAKAPNVPILVLTGFDDEELGLRTVQGGAQDYLIKGRTDRDLMVRAIRYALTRYQRLAALRFQIIFEQVVEDAMKAVFGDSGTHAIFYHLEQRFRIKKDEIADNMEGFLLGIQQIFGDGGQIFESALSKTIGSAFGLSPEKVQDGTLEQLVNIAKSNFYESIGQTESNLSSPLFGRHPS